ncbi:MAG: ribosomal protein L7/L12 [Rubripirellula sp.]
MSQAEQELIKEIRQPRSGVEPRLVYADWLEERGDRRAEYLRAEVAFAGSNVGAAFLGGLVGAKNAFDLHQQKFVELNELRLAIDPDWAEEISSFFDFLILSFGRKKLSAVKVVKAVTDGSLMSCKLLTESAPAVVLKGWTFPSVAPLMKNLMQADFLEDALFSVQGTDLMAHNQHTY